MNSDNISDTTKLIVRYLNGDMTVPAWIFCVHDRFWNKAKKIVFPEQYKKRVGLSPKTRFKVFGRDDFTCQYCGRKPPETILEIDHIRPASKGGSDDEKNLRTACRDCNRGKGVQEL